LLVLSPEHVDAAGKPPPNHFASNACLLAQQQNNAKNRNCVWLIKKPVVTTFLALAMCACGVALTQAGRQCLVHVCMSMQVRVHALAWMGLLHA